MLSAKCWPIGLWLNVFIFFDTIVEYHMTNLYWIIYYLVLKSHCTQKNPINCTRNVIQYPHYLVFMLRNHQTHGFRVINNKLRALAGCPNNDSVTMAMATSWWSMLAADENMISQETRLVRLSMLRLASLQLVTLYLASDPWSHPVRIRSTHC